MLHNSQMKESFVKDIDGVIYLSFAEAEKKFGWGRDTLYRWRLAGRLKAYKFLGDRHTYWREDELVKAQVEPIEIEVAGRKK